MPGAAFAHAVPNAFGELVAIVFLHVSPSLFERGAPAGISTDEWPLPVEHARHLEQHPRGVERHVLAMSAVFGHQAVVKRDREPTADAKVHVIVGTRVHARIEASDLAQHRAPEHDHRGHSDAVSPEQLRVHISMRPHRLTRGQSRAVSRNVTARSRHESKRRVLDQARHVLTHAVWQ